MDRGWEVPIKREMAGRQAVAPASQAERQAVAPASQAENCDFKKSCKKLAAVLSDEKTV